MCRALRDDLRTRDIPVIFLTSMDTPETIIDSFVEEADVYLTKPIKRSELLSQVALTLTNLSPRI